MDHVGEALRSELARAADAVVPSGDGLTRIRARIAEPRRPWWRRLFPTRSKNGAPGVEPGTPPQAAELEGTTAMTAIVTRHARDLHAGDIVTHDPDHDRPVRWRVQAPPKLTAFGVAQFDYTDLADGSRGTAWFDALARLPVEPAAWPERAR